MATMPQSHILARDLVIGESARWHDGRLWLSNWGAQEILRFDLEGHREVITKVPTTIPFSIDWLPRWSASGGRRAFPTAWRSPRTTRP
jgi:hypothetical protein